MGGHSTSVVDIRMKGWMKMISMRERSSDTKGPADPWLRMFYTAMRLVLRCGGPDVWRFQTMNAVRWPSEMACESGIPARARDTSLRLFRGGDEEEG